MGLEEGRQLGPLMHSLARRARWATHPPALLAETAGPPLSPCTAAGLPEEVAWRGDPLQPGCPVDQKGPLPSTGGSGQGCFDFVVECWIPHWAVKVTAWNTPSPLLLAVKRPGSLQEPRASVLQHRVRDSANNHEGRKRCPCR